MERNICHEVIGHWKLLSQRCTTSLDPERPFPAVKVFVSNDMQPVASTHYRSLLLPYVRDDLYNNFHTMYNYHH